MKIIVRSLVKITSSAIVTFFILLTLANTCNFAQEKRFITVAADGSGDFKSITAAIQSLPMFNYQRTEIFVKNGVYNEKIKIDQDYITIKGESREKTILQYSQLRTDWIAKKDSIGPAVINLNGDDFILENITVENTQPQIGPHAFTIYGTGTRTIIQNANIISKGGDTVSLWDYKTGMYYHANCYFEGAVDFVCPRGWCFIRDSQFYEVKKTAAIWHAGGDNINQKFVIMNSFFNGVKGFELGRHHYEAQFYLIDCIFSDSMSSKPIYRVVNADSTKNRPFNWGSRYYFSNNKSNQKLEWNIDNLSTSQEVQEKKQISPCWVFGGKWDPESKEGPQLISIALHGNSILIVLNEKVSVIGRPEFVTNTGSKISYTEGAGSNTLRFAVPSNFEGQKSIKINGIDNGKIIASSASISERKLMLEFPIQIDR